MTSVSATIAPAIPALLQQAAEWRLISLLMQCPRGDWGAELAGAAREVVDEQLRQAAELAQQQGSEGLYHTIFGPGGPAAPREVSYCDGILAGRLLAELRAQYAAFGYTGLPDESPDHVACEAGFVAYLRFKEAFARHIGAADEAEITAEAARHFVEAHVAPMAAPLSDCLGRSGVGYLALAAAALGQRAGRP